MTNSKRVTRHEREMVLDYWRRRFRGERDPLRGMMRKFKIWRRTDPEVVFARLQIYDVSKTEH